MTEPRTVHIVGAGLAGLSAALQLSLTGHKVFVYEAAPHAGGRCRSYYDKDLDCRIDNGNHLVLSGNVATQDYLELSGARETVSLAKEPFFPFMDMGTGERWALRMNKGRIPFWLLDPQRRVAGTSLTDYFSILRVLLAGQDDTLDSSLNRQTTLFKRLWEPLAIAALNTEVENASAHLLANVFAQSFGRGGAACRPILPKLGLTETFVTPCLETIRQQGGEIRFGARLRALEVSADGRVTVLRFSDQDVPIAAEDWVVLAVPAWAASDLIPNLLTPTAFRAIANIHYRLEAPHNPAGFTGVVGALAEWVFVKQGVVSVTVSAADRYDEQGAGQEEWAKAVWEDVARLFDLDPKKMPPWRVVREKRATFAATPAQEKMRPTAYIGWKNLVLAGDWTATTLPSTIEGALRSGVKAAQIVLRWE